MINEAECKETLNKLREMMQNVSEKEHAKIWTLDMLCTFEGKWSPYLSAVQSIEKYMETEDESLREAAVKCLDHILTTTDMEDELFKAMAIWTLGEVSKHLEDGGKYARFARDMAYETVLSQNEKSADIQAVLASAILSLELNRHLPRFMRQVYDQHARILVDEARKSETLSDMGIWFLKDAIEKLLVTRRNYRW